MIKQLSNVSKILHNGKQVLKIIRGSDEEVIYQAAHYTVSTGGWRLSPTLTNPNPDLYDGVYESNSNYNVSNGYSYIYIDIDGYSEFTIYVRSYGEAYYDYVTVGRLDQTPTKSSSASGTNYYSFYSNTLASYYTPITFSGIDGGSHRITILYAKDGSVNSNADRGYLYIPKNQ